jgi:large conductance mechanosensitive channel
MFKEFKAFALRGNALDLAVGIVIGAAFTGIVNSLVNDVIMNLVGAIGDEPDFSSYVVHVGASSIRYGRFVNAIVNFLIVAFALFLFVRTINRVLRPKGAEPESDVRECPYCKEPIHIAATRCRACTSEVVAIAQT